MHAPPDAVPAASLTPTLDRLLAPGGPDAAVVVRLVASPVGALVLAAIDEGLVFLEFATEERLARQIGSLTRHLGTTRGGDHPIIDRATTELAEYFAGTRRQFDVPLVIRGSPFQESVWRELLRIPYGETRAYADVADTLQLKNGQRAVGLANGQNRIAIIIPCHRVIERSGGLRGYGGGVWRKKFLLDHEFRSAPVGALAGTPLAAMAAPTPPDVGSGSPQSK
ncbi:MAG: methylated-DNA--[protein]-cysteine S-methyltransferase [Gemmatimonadales bacterium]